ncbi:hypothetical protein [Aliagarivorans marinus]|uniref:hypothetical protein n=1 Tax=Aliagarivorans marinus TaxID=561965 RepID=UPI00042A466D|nr:hypothetical protein [Aliagarivorans marinus]
MRQLNSLLSVRYRGWLRFTVSAYALLGSLALLSQALSGAFQVSDMITRLGPFPLSFPWALSLFFVSVLAAYSLLYASRHGMWLLRACALAYLLDRALAPQLNLPLLLAIFEALHLLCLAMLLYLSWKLEHRPSPQVEQLVATLQQSQQESAAESEQEPEEAASNPTNTATTTEQDDASRS